MKLVSKGLSQGVLLCCTGVGLQISFLTSYLCLELKKYFPIQTFSFCWCLDSYYSLYLLIYASCVCSLCQFFGYWFCEINCPDSQDREICTLEKIVTKKAPTPHLKRMLRAKITNVVNYSCQQSLGRSVGCAPVHFQVFLLSSQALSSLAIILFLSSPPCNYSK